MKLGVPASHRVIVPLSSSFFKFVFLSLSLCASTHPGILTIGVPICDVTGGKIGTAIGGSVDIHLGTSWTTTSRILKLLRRISGMGIIQLAFRAPS